MKRFAPVCTAAPTWGPRLAHTCGAAGVALWLFVAQNAAADPSCSVSTPGLAFGSYDVFAASVTNQNATVSVTCNLNPPPSAAEVDYVISLSPGSSGSFVQRQMQSSAGSLNYNLYTSNAYSAVWGDGTAASATVAGAMTLKTGNTTQTNQHTVYGQIPALQDAGVSGNYLDNVTVTITY